MSAHSRFAGKVGIPMIAQSRVGRKVMLESDDAV